ncbi:hypothetical protein KEK_05822 [Mycolicibacterium thermoresistibile ATCC 19527]|uniref:Uncharacterized protein n=1 Tax=Mycolicibacterium thermoresistibile (strain ATCC 19527 / DSM 44167 / CIP 105390 / JCM 6362 / NCTC 10409 / 316) TaxID=1078020 RepID=G7CDV6_MYCT3|nr:hypothetical protein KEK_05822 [Mycolicibacterium thermoresistibile ATCC 19527]
MIPAAASHQRRCGARERHARMRFTTASSATGMETNGQNDRPAAYIPDECMRSRTSPPGTLSHSGTTTIFS